MEHHHHAHDRHVDHTHTGLRLGLGVRPIHRIGRRQFLADLGRRTFAVAVLGGAAAACSSDDTAAPVRTGGPDDTGDADDTAGTPATTDATPTTAATATGDTADAGDDTGAAGDDTDGLRWAQANLGFVSAYVLVRGNEAAVVDTGSSGSADQIGEALATLGATYDDVRHVVLTHSHPDHIGSLPAVLERTSAVAATYAGEADIPNISAPSDLFAVGDGDDVFGLQIIHTPGHTPGSISLFDPGIGLLVAGDALNGTGDGTGLSGPDERFSSDLATANDSVLKLAAFDVEAVAMGHGQPVESGAGPLLAALAGTL